MSIKDMARTLPFASLLGIRAETGDDDDERKKRDDESDDDYAKRMKALDDKGEDEEEKAESDDDKDAKAAAPGADIRAAVLAERARCAAIFAHGLKVGRPHAAGALACDTDMAPEAAAAFLDAAGKDQPQGKGPSLADRMSGVKTPNPGASAPEQGDPNSPAAVAQQIIAAAKKARGEKA